ncbi:MAG: ribonuclease Z [Flavobacteriia bacterium]|nr:MAG: ribonuclease Z [Flavobacteriia bacterium]
MSLKLTILGCHSATPRVNVYPSAQVLDINNHTFLIDCGEGTQMQLRKYKVSFSKIGHIFISHLHGDHFFGLVGLLSSLGLLGRQKEVHVYGPEGIKKAVDLMMDVSQVHQTYPIYFHELTATTSELIYTDDRVEVYTIPLKHRVYTNGYLFKEKQVLRNLDIDAIKKYPEIARCDYYRIKKGEDFLLADGTVVSNEKLTLPPKKLLSYAYCSDTSYNPEIIPLIYKTDLLYHEATFLDQHEELAIKTGHSTVKQAATIAKKAKVGQLVVGHYSSRYQDKEPFITEGQEIFTPVLLAESGKVITVD